MRFLGRTSSTSDPPDHHNRPVNAPTAKVGMATPGGGIQYIAPGQPPWGGIPSRSLSGSFSSTLNRVLSRSRKPSSGIDSLGGATSRDKSSKAVYSRSHGISSGITSSDMFRAQAAVGNGSLSSQRSKKEVYKTDEIGFRGDDFGRMVFIDKSPVTEGNVSVEIMDRYTHNTVLATIDASPRSPLYNRTRDGSQPRPLSRNQIARKGHAATSRSFSTSKPPPLPSKSELRLASRTLSLETDASVTTLNVSTSVHVCDSPTVVITPSSPKLPWYRHRSAESASRQVITPSPSPTPSASSTKLFLATSPSSNSSYAANDLSLVPRVRRKPAPTISRSTTLAESTQSRLPKPIVSTAPTLTYSTHDLSPDQSHSSGHSQRSLQRELHRMFDELLEECRTDDCPRRRLPSISPELDRVTPTIHLPYAVVATNRLEPNGSHTQGKIGPALGTVSLNERSTKSVYEKRRPFVPSQRSFEPIRAVKDSLHSPSSTRVPVPPLSPGRVKSAVLEIERHMVLGTPPPLCSPSRTVTPIRGLGDILNKSLQVSSTELTADSKRLMEEARRRRIR